MQMSSYCSSPSRRRHCSKASSVNFWLLLSGCMRAYAPRENYATAAMTHCMKPPATMQQQQPQQPQLPPGWLAVTDPVSNRVYFANPSTGQTSWEPPVPVSAPPPPPVFIQPPPPKRPFNELEQLSAGKIADMCHVQPNHEPYKPLESHLLSAQPPHTEESRLETRLATLEDQLRRQSS